MMEQQIYRIYTKSNGITQDLYKKYCQKMKIGKTTRTCSVCFVKLEQGDIISQLPCKHIFHNKCIKPWLKLSPCCPNCRLDIKKYDLEQKKIAKSKLCSKSQQQNNPDIDEQQIDQNSSSNQIQENQNPDLNNEIQSPNSI